MRVSVIQMNPGANKADNIAQARRLIEQAVAQDRPDIVSLPEVWDSLGGDRATRTANAEVLPAKGSNAPGGEAYGGIVREFGPAILDSEGRISRRKPGRPTSTSRAIPGSWCRSARSVRTTFSSLTRR